MPRFPLVLACIALIFSSYGMNDANSAGPHLRPLATKKVEVVGGHSVSPTESPWQVALISAASINHVDGVFCGGTLIDSQWVLTAAHCFFPDQTNCAQLGVQGFYVAYGSTDLGKQVSLISPAEVHLPKGYDCHKKAKDIALIKLRAPVKVHETIRLASLVETTALSSGTKLQTTGWGLTDASGWKSRELLEVDISLVSHATCATHYGVALPESDICAGGNGKDACKGDSGGPLYSRTGTQVVQYGIVSFGDGCGKAETPGVYTSVAEYLDWISGVLKTASCTPAQEVAHIC